MNSPVFSIIVPTFNSSKTIEKCLGSLQRQTYRNFEVIIQDGLSDDNTCELIYNFCNLDSFPAISLISESDLGVYDAMNKGIQRVNGSWIYFLGSDDELFDWRTLECIANHLSPSFDIIYGDVFSPHHGGRYAGKFTPELLFIQNIPHQAIFYRTSVFKRLGCFDLTYKIAADWEHNMRWFLNHEIGAHYVDLVVANFADGGLSSSHPDYTFDSLKSLLYVYHGRKTLSFATKFSLLTNRFLHALRRRDFKTVSISIRFFVYLFPFR